MPWMYYPGHLGPIHYRAYELFYRSEATLVLPCPAKYTPEDSRLPA